LKQNHHFLVYLLKFKKMKIYTKTGDKGKTSLIGGTRVSKHHFRIDAYGTIDELNSYLGLLSDYLESDKSTIEIIREIQDRLFTIGSSLATDPNANSKMAIPDLKASDIEFLENKIDEFELNLNPLKSFILPGGNKASSVSHVARCVCRRAERMVVELSENEKVNELICPYLNRLSDFLFVLSRKILHDNNINEVPWKPRM
jgi:cob(I)alamin adenosyltransferase